MKRSRKLVIAFLIVGGLALLLYPNVRMIMSHFNQTVAVSNYEEGVLHYDDAKKAEQYRLAKIYNESIAGTDVQDPFIPGSGVVLPDNYLEVLDIDSGIMGTLEIPCIDVNLPIYHGVTEDVISKGVGHLKETAFPIGGEGNHTVLTSHRGLPEARLFTDLNKMEIGDSFYIYIMNDVFAYEVDQIKVIEPTETGDLKPVEGKDYVTLLTCTPYGVNSHRLLVRGLRTEYVEETKVQIEEKAVYTEWYMTAAIIWVVLLMFTVWIVRLVRRKKQDKI